MSASTQGPVKVQRATMPLPMAWLGAASPMPCYRWQQPIPSTNSLPPAGLSEEELHNLFDWGDDSILPYQVQSRYNRDLKDGALDVLVLENDRFRASVAPGLGGRLLSLYDKRDERDLLFRNPVFRPANLAALNAWFSGGVEWNGLTPGHSPTTASPVFAAVVPTDRGDILRLYEFDRTTECIWQVSLFLPEGDGPLTIHGQIINPNDAPVPVYWWTNIAVATPEGGRVLSSTDYSIEHVLPDNHLERFDFPRKQGPDLSYPASWQGATSVFFRSRRPARNLVALLDRHGQGTAHIANENLPGRKFFYFGAGSGGQHWMDYLAREGEGDYVEIQAGITPHQNQRFDLDAGAVLEWTSVLLPLSVPAELAHNEDYACATAAAEAASCEVMPDQDLQALGSFMAEAAKMPGGKVLCKGSSWGMRHEKLLGRKMTDNLSFESDAPRGFWDNLAEGATPTDCKQLPDGFAFSPRWLERLQHLGDDHWLGTLYRSIAALDAGNKEEAHRLACLSVKLNENWLARRQLALTVKSVEDQREHYLVAWSAGDAPVELAIEIVDFLQAECPRTDALAFIAALPEEMKQHERILLARARIAAENGELEELETLLSHDFSTIREGETITEDLWRALVALKAARTLGHEPGTDELSDALEQNPLPQHLDFRMRVENHTHGDA